MQDIGIYSDRMNLDFETLLECVTSCDEEVFKDAKAQRGQRRRDVQPAVQRPSDE